MQTIEYRFRDKAGWGDGPWQSEPDKKQWQDEATGLPCLMVRNPLGSLCGYVGLAPGHAMHGMGYDAVHKTINVTVHGGLTFAEHCAEGEPDHGICHHPDAGEPDRVWWLGFDCAHSGDFNPKGHSSARIFWEGLGSHETYRDQAYVEAECASLARQLAALAA